jgi:hypothetical protein
LIMRNAAVRAEQRTHVHAHSVAVLLLAATNPVCPRCVHKNKKIAFASFLRPSHGKLTVTLVYFAMFAGVKRVVIPATKAPRRCDSAILSLGITLNPRRHYPRDSSKTNMRLRGPLPHTFRFCLAPRLLLRSLLSRSHQQSREARGLHHQLDTIHDHSQQSCISQPSRRAAALPSRSGVAAARAPDHISPSATRGQILQKCDRTTSGAHKARWSGALAAGFLVCDSPLRFEGLDWLSQLQ